MSLRINLPTFKVPRIAWIPWCSGSTKRCKLRKKKFSLRYYLIWGKPTGSSHCVLLELYYSTDFPWQFDRKMTKSLITWWLEKKVVKWQFFKSALCNLTQKLLLLNFVSMQFLTEISNQSGSQIPSLPNPFMDPLEKKNLFYQNLFYFLQGKSFPPWMASFN